MNENSNNSSNNPKKKISKKKLLDSPTDEIEQSVKHEGFLGDEKWGILTESLSEPNIIITGDGGGCGADGK